MTESIYYREEHSCSVSKDCNSSFVTFEVKDLLHSSKVTNRPVTPQTQSVSMLCARHPGLDEYAVMGSLAPS